MLHTYLLNTYMYRNRIYSQCVVNEMWLQKVRIRYEKTWKSVARCHIDLNINHKCGFMNSDVRGGYYLSSCLFNFLMLHWHQPQLWAETQSHQINIFDRHFNEFIFKSTLFQYKSRWSIFLETGFRDFEKLPTIRP